MSSLVATRATVRATVERLPEHYRRAIELRDIERLSHEEAAARLGLKRSHAASATRAWTQPPIHVVARTDGSTTGPGSRSSG